jgi:hypothetical protein
VVEIRCDTAGDKGHLLARVEDGAIAIWCVKCKAWHRVTISDLVRDAVLDLRCNGRDNDDGGKLLW